MSQDASTGACSCGCGVMPTVTEAAEPCACGCACCTGEQVGPEEEIVQLRQLKESVERRLDELEDQQRPA